MIPQRFATSLVAVSISIKKSRPKSRVQRLLSSLEKLAETSNTKIVMISSYFPVKNILPYAMSHEKTPMKYHTIKK